MAVDIGFGIDTSVLSGDDQDLDDTFNEINDISILSEDVYKALSTPSAPVVVIDDRPPAPLLFWEDPPVSFDLRDSLNDSLSPAEAAILDARIQAIYVQDRRFDRIRAGITFDAPTQTLKADVEGEASGQLLHIELVADSNQIRVVA